MTRVVALALSLTMLMSTACVSSPVRITTDPIAPNEKDLGEAFGSSTGIMLLGFIPIKQNSRFQAAWDEAVQSKGASRLVNPTIQEHWFWAFVLNGYIFSITGTAVGPK